MKRRHGYNLSAHKRLDAQARTIDCLCWQYNRQDGALTDLLGQVQDLETTVAELRRLVNTQQAQLAEHGQALLAMADLVEA
jgi:uncharacterized protein YlxW (UPF0749 family)